MLVRSTRQRLDLQTSGASGVVAASAAAGVVGANDGILDEKVLQLVFKSMNYNPFHIAKYSLVCKTFADVTKRVIWKEFCLSRAPKMVEDLLSATAGGRNGTVAGGWLPLGKLLFHCPGSHQSKHFYSKHMPDHFVCKSRFSKTSGKSFLPLKFRSDTLYMSDCCEHLDNGDDDDLGVYRGVFRAFRTSRTRRFLIENRVKYEEAEFCPFCREKVWSMRGAELVPPSAFRRLGAYKDNVDYFVCVNGHLHGMASLISPSDSELSGDDEEKAAQGSAQGFMQGRAGFRAGFHAGFRAGFHAGFRAGFHAGFRAGFHAGFRAEFHAGFRAGFHAGFHAGFYARPRRVPCMGPCRGLTVQYCTGMLEKSHDDNHCPQLITVGVILCH